MHPRYLAQAEQLTVHGQYVHPSSKIAMPESIAGFQRISVARFDADELDVSAGYKLTTSDQCIVATVYAYPAPSLTSIGSAPEVIAEARAHLTDREFEHRKQEIQHSHPGAALIEERDVVRTDGGLSYTGKLAIFEFESVFAGSKMTVRSHLYVFCYIGNKWAIEYRFTHPKTQDAEQKIQEFIQKWNWYGAGA